MSSTREQIPPRRKRQHTLDNPSESQPSKRLKSSRADFYDSLSKVWLTRRALKELNRRTNCTQQPAPPSQQVYLEEISPEETLKQKRFARHGGPDLRDLQGYPAPADVDPTRAMASSSSSRSRHTKSTVPTSTSSKTRRSSAYDKDFEQHYIDHHVYLNNRKSKAGGLEGLHQSLAHPRPSLSPSRFSDHAFDDFQQKVEDTINEGEVMRDVMPIIAGHANIPNKQDLQFTRLESITNGITVDPKPDFYDGATLEDIDNSVREELGPYIIPTGHRTAPVAPNFFLEAKAPHGGADVVRRQAMQNGAYGARAMHSLQSYSEGKPVYDGNAYTVTSTYHAGTGTLKLYTTHPTAGPENAPEYHMTQIRGWDLTSDADTFRQGAAAFRNARDWAQEKRDALINAANDKATSTNMEVTRTEHMTYSGWLAALDTGSVSAPTVEDGSNPRPEAQVDDSQSYLLQPQVYTYEAQSTFGSPNDNRVSNEPIPIASNHSHAIYPNQDSNSADELAAIPTTERKRKYKTKTPQSRDAAAKSRSNNVHNTSRRQSKRGKVDTPPSRDWVWDDVWEENRAWDEGLGRWVYWDKANEAEKYLNDDGEWRWVKS